ncbi:MAG: hypothetical protein KJ053_10840 [Dehalococcoidia bacterium]|nr:hypothetical protein [Dehalococcoidia bacterium]
MAFKPEPHTLSRHGRMLLLVVLVVTLGLLSGLLLGSAPADADHSFEGWTWDDCGNHGCIGWKEFAELGDSALIAHMDNGGAGCGQSIDYSWAYAIDYWNRAGTVASFEFYESDCSGENYPNVRIVPYTVYNAEVGWWAIVLTYDRRTSSALFDACWGSSHPCDNDESQNYNAQHGYDLSEVYFNTYYNPGPGWEWVARHELGHVVGLEDHHLDPYGCNSNYYGLMDDAGCDTNQLTSAEKDGVDAIHDH